MPDGPVLAVGSQQLSPLPHLPFDQSLHASGSAVGRSVLCLRSGEKTEPHMQQPEIQPQCFQAAEES